MDVIHTHCAGLDVHKKVVVAAIIVEGLPKGIRSFGTMTSDLLALSDWLMSCGVTHVAMESTGEYWKPIFNILENNFEVILVNAQHSISAKFRDVRRMSVMRSGLLICFDMVCLRPVSSHRWVSGNCAN
jgi:transposase